MGTTTTTATTTTKSTTSSPPTTTTTSTTTATTTIKTTTQVSATSTTDDLTSRTDVTTTTTGTLATSTTTLKPTTTLPCGGTVEEGTDYSGNDIEVTSNLKDFTSAESCSAKCFRENECLFWSWNSQTLVCALKSSDSGRVSDAAVTSGQRPCNVIPECGDVFERSVGYHGNDLTIEWDVEDNDECRQRCGNDPVCSHWGFRADQNRCVLKTSDGGRRQNNAVDSGQRPCSTTTTTSIARPQQ